MTQPERISKGLYWDEAWSLISGCTPVSAGCDNCWSAKETHMRANNPNEKVMARNSGLTEKGCFNGQIRLNHEFLDKPLRKKKPTVYAVWNDLFHESLPDEFILEAFNVMRVADHTFMVLTKRPQRMQQFISRLKWRVRANQERKYGGVWEAYLGDTNDAPLRNVYLGVTAENQQTADERIPLLLQTPAAVRFISAEPLLGGLDLRQWLADCGCIECQRKFYTDLDELDYPEDDNTKCPDCGGDIVSFSGFVGPPGISWVIVGGESGPRARPCHPDWIRSLRNQCQAAGVPYFFKQWGSAKPIGSALPGNEWREAGFDFKQKKGGRLLDNKEWNEMPVVGGG